MNNKQREQLFEDHKDLIPKMAKKFFGYRKDGVEYDDLVQEAGLGLHLATREFKPEKWVGKPFEAYAVTRIYQSMMVYFLSANKFYTPRHVVALASKIRRLNLTQFPISEISAKLETSEIAVENALIHLKGVHFVGIDEPIDNGSSPRTLADRLPDESELCAVEQANIQMFLDTLSERNKKVFILMMQENTQKDIGECIGFTRGRAGHLRQHLRGKFKEYMGAI